jgi:predicted NAD/FAD-dependent oxidoreductase
VIGAGPAGLTYASLVAADNKVTVFEKENEAGGAFRRAGKAPLFQEVEADEKSFARYIAHLVTACEMRGVQFRYATDVAARSALLERFDHIVVATGAEYRRRYLGHAANWLLDRGLARTPLLARLFTSPKIRNWFYYRARIATGSRFQSLAQSGRHVTIIGDAIKAGKSKDAIASAFEAALLAQKQDLRAPDPGPRLRRHAAPFSP